MIDCYRTLQSAATVMFYEHDATSDLRGKLDDSKLRVFNRISLRLCWNRYKEVTTINDCCKG